MTGAPCEDPTCDCCNAWRGLDDTRIAEIERLEADIVDLRRPFRGTFSVGWA